MEQLTDNSNDSIEKNYTKWYRVTAMCYARDNKTILFVNANNSEHAEQLVWDDWPKTWLVQPDKLFTEESVQLHKNANVLFAFSA